MGYSNVTGDLNVYSSTSTQTLTVRGDTVISGNVTASGQSTFGNVTVSNLSIVGSVFNVATNVQISNAISINNAGTSTVLKVVQYEGGGGGHIYNVAEFWDFQTLAMCIDPRGNVAIHQAASPGYALTVNEGVRADNITVTGNYTGSGFGLTNVPVTGLYGAVGSLQVQNTQTNVTSVGTLWTVNVTGISNLNGSILGSLATPVQSNITTVGLLTNLAVSNSISVSNIVATGNLTVLTQSNLASANIQSLDVVSSNVSAEANITTLSVATGNVQSLNVSVGANITQLSVTSLANLVSANLVTANTQSLNAVTANVTSGNVQSLVVTSGANVTVLTVGTLANISSANLVTANIQSLNVVGSNTQTLNVSTGANITQLSVTTLANLISANLVTANVQSLNVVSSNISILNVNSGANITTLTVSTLANLVTANVQTLNVVTSNTQTLNVSTGANITQLSVTTLANLASANLVTANIESLNVVSSNIQTLNVSAGANITTLTVSTLANISSANLVTANVQSLNVVSSNIQTLNVSAGANITQLSVTSLANISSANLVTANIQSLNVVSSNVSILNVNSGANVTYLTVSSQSNVVSANLVTANIQTANVTTMNLLNLNVTSTANFASANFASANIANIYTTNIVGFVGSQWVGTIGGPLYYATGNVGINTSTGLDSNLTVAGNLFVSTNISTPVLNVTSYANVAVLNVSAGANVTYLTISTQANVVSANLVTANVGTANVTTMNVLNLNVTSTANFASANFASANIANIYTTNIVGFVGSQWIGTAGGPLYYATGNVGINTSTGLDSNLTVAGNLFVSTNISTPILNVTSYANVSVLNVSTSANIVTANLITANIANIFTTNIVGFVGSQWSGTTGGPLSYASGNVAIGSSTNPGANLTVTGNLFVSNSITTANVIASGTITGTWNGVSQGTLLTLATNTATGTAFATSSDAPTLQAYHVPLQSFTQNAIQAVSSYTITAQGLIKFSSTGLYQITTALVMDSPVVKVALGTNTSSAFLSSTSAYTYVYTISSAASPSDSITIPINVQDISKYYYLDVFCRSAVTSGTYYLTAGTTVTGSQNGTYIQIAPFGNYISSSVNAAAGILLTTTGSTLSSPLAAASPLPTPSNTYHVTMTSGAGWSQSGTSSIVTVSPNGNLQFYQAGVFNVTICLNSASPRVPMQVGIGSSSSDSSLPTTIGSYVYSYAPMFTQDPTTTIMVPLNVTDITKYYYLDATFDPSTTVTLVSTSTFVAVTPLSSYIPSPMATASVVVSQVVTARSTSYTATSSDYYIGMSNGGTVTIPQGATLTRGKVYNIKDESGLAGTNTAYNIIIQMSGADKIDGQSNAYIQLGWTSVNLMWTGENNKWSFI